MKFLSKRRTFLSLIFLILCTMGFLYVKDSSLPMRALQSCERCTLRSLRYRSPNSSTVALGSFHGAGNTWTRHLIEQMTGLYSGSIYHSHLLIDKFPGEAYHDGRVCVVKTHCYSPNRWDRAILLYRNIKDCNIANFHRTRTHNCSGRVPLEKFKTEAWQSFVKNPANINRFTNFWDTWMSEFPRDKMLILRYERMMADLYPELVRIRDFLGVNTTDEQLRCILCVREGYHHRKKEESAEDPWKFVDQEIVQKFDEADKHISDMIAPYI